MRPAAGSGKSTWVCRRQLLHAYAAEPTRAVLKRVDGSNKRTKAALMMCRMIIAMIKTAF